MDNLYKIFHLLTLSLLILTLHCVKCNAESATDSQLCKFGDTNCIREVINELLHKNEDNKFYNFTKLDPYVVKQLHLQRNADSPVNIDLLYTNNTINGLSHSKIETVKGFGSDLTQAHSIYWYNDAISLVGNYKIDGKILLLPIVGEGLSNITLLKTNYTIKFRGKAFDKDGQTYMKSDKLHVEGYPEGLIFKIDNLFNGDQALGDNMNKLLNENWLDIYNELRQPLLKEFARIVQPIIDGVFSAQPYEKLFLN